MSTGNPHDSHTPADQVEFASQDLERGVLNEIVTEEQRQRQELEALLRAMRSVATIPDTPYGKLVDFFADCLSDILQR